MSATPLAPQVESTSEPLNAPAPSSSSPLSSEPSSSPATAQDIPFVDLLLGLISYAPKLRTPTDLKFTQDELQRLSTLFRAAIKECETFGQTAPCSETIDWRVITRRIALLDQRANLAASESDDDDETYDDEEYGPPPAESLQWLAAIYSLLNLSLIQITPPLPSLPPELIDHILSFVGLQPYPTGLELKTLQNCSLVSKPWRSLAEKYIYQSVVIVSEVCALKLIDTLPTNEGLRKMMRSLKSRSAKSLGEDPFDFNTKTSIPRFSNVTLDTMAALVELLPVLEKFDLTEGVTWNGNKVMVFPSSLRSLAADNTTMQLPLILQPQLTNLTHFSWDDSHNLEQSFTLSQVPSLIALDIWHPSISLLHDMRLHLPHLRRLSIPESTFLQSTNADDLDPFFDWLTQLSQLASLEELALDLPYGSHQLINDGGGHVVKSLYIMSHLPHNLKVLVYLAPLDVLANIRPDCVSVRDVLHKAHHRWPSSLAKINFTTHHWSDWPSTTNRKAKFEMALSEGLLSSEFRELMDGVGVEIVAGERWFSDDDGAGRYRWDIEV